MATANFYLDTRRAKEGNRFPIKLRIQHNGKFLISIGFDATQKAWTGNSYTKEEPNYKIKNTAIRNILASIENVLLLLHSTGGLRSMTDKQLKQHLESLLTGNKKTERKFVDYLDEFVALKNNLGTKSVYGTTRNKVVEFDPDCTFDTMDKKWLTSFETWMAENMKVNAYAIHLRNIRAVFNYAIDEEITTLYPFRKFKIKKEETRKRSLTVEQLRILRDFPCEDYQVKYRDMFMLMFYLIGINAADLFMATPNQLVNGRFEYKRAKTHKLYSIKVHPEAMAIIEKYRGKKYLLNIMDEYLDYKNFLHRMGIVLKQIGEVERVGRGGKKVRQPLFSDISSYWARHTWATIAASLDIPKETISAGLGHEIGSGVTSIYIDFDQKKVDKANRKVIDYVFHLEEGKEKAGG
ncbi:site-specific integrase [Bacteroides sp.]|uniref:site-specific integrase n=1 Tax=Bacteroides sp. TaxID=29523 RepID=UPI002619A3CA|nr:site-specific integrase [Bacteroides sp.]